jgi:antitoxin component YwqK of YwqJK toxin-antitoxin module
LAPTTEGKPADAAGSAPASPAPPTASNEPSAVPEADVVVELIKERYPGGAIKVEREMTQDASGNYHMHGAWRHFDEQGRLIVDGKYVQNQKDGLWRRFYHGDESPLLMTAPYKDFTAPFISSATFHNGAMHGKWTITDSKQRKVHELEFCDGERHGKATWYYPNGAIMLQARYEHGRANGDIIQFAPDSSIIAKESYQSGRKLAPKVEFYDQAQQVKRQEVTYLHAMLVVKTPDNWETATLASFESRGQDERHGPFMTWHSNGQIAKQGEFRYNQPVGKINYWFANGQKQTEGTYLDGRQEGVWTWWHENGQKAITGEYRDAQPVGKWSWWTAAGKIAQRADLSHDRPVVGANSEATSEVREAKQPVQPGLLPR